MHYSPQLQQVYTQLDISEAFETVALWTRSRREQRAAEVAACEAQAEEADGGLNASCDGNEPDDEEGQEEAALVVAPKTLKDIINSDYWIGDTGATTHITNDATEMKNLVASTQKMMMGNGTETQGLQEGMVEGTLCDKGGKVLAPISLSNVTYSKDAKLNLLSLTQLMKKGWAIGSSSDSIVMTKGNKVLKFDVTISTPKGVLYCIRIKRDTREAGNPNVDNLKNIIAPYSTVHDWLVHMGKDLTMVTAKKLGISMIGKSEEACENCLTAKAKKKGVSKDSDHEPSNEVNGRIFIDLSTIKKPADCPEVSKVYKPHWRMMVDEKTGLKFTEFF